MKYFLDPLFPAWSPTVRFGAMNCADQSCDVYQVQGTPTIRIFHPGTRINRLDSAFYGYNLPVRSDKEYIQDIILYNLAVVGSKGIHLPVRLNNIRKIPSPDEKDLSAMFDNLPETATHAAIIFELEGKHSVGKKVIMDTSNHSHIVPVLRANYEDGVYLGWKIHMNPTMVVVDTDGKVNERVDGWGVNKDRDRFVNIIKSYADGNDGKTMNPEKRVTLPATTLYTVPDKILPAVKDEVFMSDLEKAVEYSLMKEVPMQTHLSQVKLQTLVYFIETLLNNLPNLRPPMQQFLISLREWPVQMRYTAVSHIDYKNKVDQLSKFYQPFAATPSDWEGCVGSQEQFRGYPCSLWTLFHTLIVNGAEKDPSLQYGGVSTVASAIIGYVREFFSCRSCADHFSSHISQLGYLPHTGDQSILWLWTIHNIVNHNLAGDTTEDPTRPKIQWPSKQHCPACRGSTRWSTSIRVNGELWNQAEVLAYTKNIYAAENIVTNVANTSSDGQIQHILNELKDELHLDDSKEFDAANEKILDYCRK